VDVDIFEVDVDVDVCDVDVDVCDVDVVCVGDGVVVEVEVREVVDVEVGEIVEVRDEVVEVEVAKDKRKYGQRLIDKINR
jgi:hypothetical protein